MDESIFSLIEAGDSEGLARLLGDDPRAIGSRTPQGLSPLIHACYQMKPQLLGQLKAAQKDFDVFEAAATGENRTLSTLLVADRGLAQGWSPDGFTALHLAAFFRQPEAVTQLLAAGADPDAVAQNPSLLRPLHSAAASGEVESVRALLAAGARPDTVQAGGYTALHSAARQGHEAMVQALCEAGADRTLRTDKGESAADLAPADSPVRALLS